MHKISSDFENYTYLKAYLSPLNQSYAGAGHTTTRISILDYYISDTAKNHSFQKSLLLRDNLVTLHLSLLIKQHSLKKTKNNVHICHLQHSQIQG